MARYNEWCSRCGRASWGAPSCTECSKELRWYVYSPEGRALPEPIGDSPDESIKAEINDWHVVRRIIIRQLASGLSANQAVNMAHKYACDRIAELEAELERKK